jgi:hypothetical protein
VKIEILILKAHADGFYPMLILETNSVKENTPYVVK